MLVFLAFLMIFAAECANVHADSEYYCESPDMVIVPIVMSYLGKAAWWLPKWLDKTLPKVSIEGEIKD